MFTLLIFPLRFFFLRLRFYGHGALACFLRATALAPQTFPAIHNSTSQFMVLTIKRGKCHSGRSVTDFLVIARTTERA